MDRSDRKRLVATAVAVSLATGVSCLPSGAAEKNPLCLVQGIRTERLVESVPARVSAMAQRIASAFPTFPTLRDAVPKGPRVVPASGPELDDADILKTALVEIGRRDDPFDYVLKDAKGPTLGVSADVERAVSQIATPSRLVSLEKALDALSRPLPSPFVEKSVSDTHVEEAAGRILAGIVAPGTPSGTVGSDGVSDPDPERFGGAVVPVAPAAALFDMPSGGRTARIRHAGPPASAGET